MKHLIPRSMAPVVFVLCILSLGNTPCLAANDKMPNKARIVVKDDPKTLTSTITIQGKNNSVAWKDILVGLARAHDFDDSAFADLIPDYSFRLDQPSTGWAIFAWNLSLPQGIHLRISSPKNRNRQLVITLDREVMLASKRRLQKMLRKALLDHLAIFPVVTKKDFGLKLMQKPKHCKPGDPLVVVLPGYQENSDRFSPLAVALNEKGYYVGAFSYPNDQAIADSGKLLAEHLQRIAKEQPGRKIRIVAYSMGGLVARWAIENPKLDPGNIEQLIMVATPNQGSRLAMFGFGLELWEHLVESKECDPLKKFYASIEDGLGQASEDLDPDSVFLHKLNTLPRNPKVRYSIFLGTNAALTSASVQCIKKNLLATAKYNRFVRFFGPKINSALDDLGEVIYGQGDGVVAVSRGKISGVDDVTLLPFDHLTVAQPFGSRVTMRLLGGISSRLQMSFAAP